MADFSSAYDKLILNEGGYKLTNIAGDRGGQTYAGISRKMNPSWAGWRVVDEGETPPTQLVREFYQRGWWEPLQCDKIVSDAVAESIFDFAVNTSGYGKPVVAAKLVQVVCEVQPDGIIGPKTLVALNDIQEDLFLAKFALAKIARYRDICVKDRSQMKFLLGWINRSLKGAVR